MAAGTLIFSLVAGSVGAFLVWRAARAASARLAVAAGGHSSAPGKERPQDAAAVEVGQIRPEHVAAVYRRVFWRRVGGMALCLAALAVWLMEAHWLASLLLAGMGCMLQYLAYRLRTCYALRIAQQKQEQQLAATGGGITAESQKASVEKKRSCPAS